MLTHGSELLSQFGSKDVRRLLFKSPTKCTYNSWFITALPIIIVFMFRPFIDHHEGKTYLQSTHQMQFDDVMRVCHILLLIRKR